MYGGGFVDMVYSFIISLFIICFNLDIYLCSQLQGLLFFIEDKGLGSSGKG